MKKSDIIGANEDKRLCQTLYSFLKRPAVLSKLQWCCCPGLLHSALPPMAALWRRGWETFGQISGDVLCAPLLSELRLWWYQWTIADRPKRIWRRRCQSGFKDRGCPSAIWGSKRVKAVAGRKRKVQRQLRRLGLTWILMTNNTGATCLFLLIQHFVYLESEAVSC